VVLKMLKRVRRAFGGEPDPTAQLFISKQSAFAQDMPEKRKFDKVEFLRNEAPKSCVPIGEIVKRYSRFVKPPGHLTFEEYVRYRLYERDPATLDETQVFVSDRFHWSLVSRVCDPTYDALTSDKFITYSLLSLFGFAVPNTVGVVTEGARQFPKVRRASNEAELAALLSDTGRPLFFKPNTGIGSYAAFICDGFDGETLRTRPHGMLSPAAAMAKFGRRDFLVQDVLRNHADLRRLSDNLATIRFTNFLIHGEVHCPIVFLKLPVGDNIADNFWRPGNLLADIDPESGRIVRAIRGTGPEMENVESLNGIAVIGLQIPCWRETVALNRACSLCLAPLPFNSFDIAVTDSGPVIVEANTGGSLELPQLASGRGILTPDIRMFFKI
jgi:Sugar-transfer associated ATP-grasp